jgi:hypothetical protein
MIRKRNRRKHTVGFEQRIAQAASRLRLLTEGLSPGAEREALLLRVSQH